MDYSPLECPDLSDVAQGDFACIGHFFYHLLIILVTPEKAPGFRSGHSGKIEYLSDSRPPGVSSVFECVALGVARYALIAY